MKEHYLIVGPCAAGKTILAQFLQKGLQSVGQNSAIVEVWDVQRKHTTHSHILALEKGHALLFVAESEKNFRALKLGVKISRTINLTKS